MPHPVKEHTNLALASLWEIAKHSEFLDTAAQRAEAMKALAAQAEAELAKSTETVRIMRPCGVVTGKRNEC